MGRLCEGRKGNNLLSKFDSLAGAKNRKGASVKNGSKATNATPATVARRGRPSGFAGGKRSDPDFTQITAYIRKDTHADVKIALLKQRDGRDMSDLIESLFAQWLKSPV
jgi:hypothetical protein